MSPPNTTVVKQIHLNSADGQSYNDTSDVYFSFQQPLWNCSPNTDVFISLLNISIPYVFPNVSLYNNIFSYQIYGWPFPTTITIPVGQYNICDLLTFFNSNVQLVSDGFSFKYSHITKMLSIVNGLYNFTVLQNPSTIDLGLTELSSGGYTLNATKVINLIFTQNIYIDFSELNTPNMLSLTKKQSSVLARVPICGEFGTVLTWTNLNGYYSKLNATNCAMFHIRLIDDKGRLLQLNGLNWSCTIEVYFIEKAQRWALNDLTPRFSWEI